MRIITGYLIRVNKMAPGEGQIGDLRPLVAVVGAAASSSWAAAVDDTLSLDIAGVSVLRWPTFRSAELANCLP
jgi:hypothetical protein